MKKRHIALSRRAGGKKEGLDRLQAESRRFQDELRCIRSSLSCPCQYGHVDSSEESSENSAWDSPQTLKQLMGTMPCITDNKTCAQSSPETESRSFRARTENTRNGQLCTNTLCPSIVRHVSTCRESVSDEYCNPSPASAHHSSTNKKSISDEYYVRSPSSVLVSEQHRAAGSCLHTASNPVHVAGDKLVHQEAIHNSTSIFGHHEPAKTNIVRITATAIFTRNGGNLVLSAPRPLNEDSHSCQGSMFLPCLDNCLKYKDQEEAKLRQTLGDKKKGFDDKKGWKSMTTVSLGDNSTCICTESMMTEFEQNKDSQTGLVFPRTSSIATHQSDRPTDGNDINNSRQESFSKEALSAVEPEISNTMEFNTLLHAARTHPIQKFNKLKEAVKSGKDSILARRVASKIRFMLQVNVYQVLV
ncbi:hypothetical protein L7F22_000510 [Adiantum nelumboides]|nr:hypothetical protein [Adiantum nelumboides]